MEKLEACPFCGGEAVLYRKHDGAWVVSCVGCGATTGSASYGTPEEEAVERWNARHERTT